MCKKYVNFKDSDYKISIDYPCNWIVKKQFLNSIVTFIDPLKHLEDQGTIDDFTSNKINQVTPSINLMLFPININNKDISYYCNNTIVQLNKYLNNIKILKKTNCTWSVYESAELIYNGTTSNGSNLKFLQKLIVLNDKIYSITFTSSVYQFDSLLKDFNIIKNSFLLINEAVALA